MSGIYIDNSINGAISVYKNGAILSKEDAIITLVNMYQKEPSPKSALILADCIKTLKAS